LLRYLPHREPPTPVLRDGLFAILECRRIPCRRRYFDEPHIAAVFLATAFTAATVLVRNRQANRPADDTKPLLPRPHHRTSCADTNASAKLMSVSANGNPHQPRNNMSAITVT